jgi:regulator of nonsense transcripts 2
LADPKQTRNDRRKQLQELNSSVWDGVTGVFPVSANPDTSLRKNTAFIKRCRVGLVEESQKTLLSEVATLSLEKYLPEILAALCEGFTKCKSSADLFTGVEVASALHQRFGTIFSPQLLSYFYQGISNPSQSLLNTLTAEARLREDHARNDRHKIVIRVMIELWLVNVFRFASDVTDAGLEVPRYGLHKTESGIAVPPPLAALEEVLSFDLDNFSPVSIVVMVLKNYGSIIAGVKNKTESV